MHSHRLSHSDLQKPVVFREVVPVVAQKEKVALTGIALVGAAGCFLASQLGLGRSWTLGVAGLSLGVDLFYLSRATWKEMEEIDRLATERLFDCLPIQSDCSPRIEELINDACDRKKRVLWAALAAPLAGMSIGGPGSRTYRLELLKLKAEQDPLQGTFLDFFPELKAQFGEMLKGVSAADVLSYYNPTGHTPSQSASADSHLPSEEDRSSPLSLHSPNPTLSTDFFQELMKRKGLELPEQPSGSSSHYSLYSDLDPRSVVLIDQLLSYNPHTKELTLGDASNPGNPINQQIYSCLQEMLEDQVISSSVRKDSAQLTDVLRTIQHNILIALANKELNLPGASGSKEDHFGLSLNKLKQIVEPFEIFRDMRYLQQSATVTVGGVNFNLNSFSSTPDLLALLLFCPDRTPKGLKPEALESIFSTDDFKISVQEAGEILRSNQSDWSYRIGGALSSSSSSQPTTYDARVIIAACLPESGAAAIPASVRPLLEQFRQANGVHIPTAKAELESFFPNPADFHGADQFRFHFERQTRDGEQGMKVTSYFEVPSQYESTPQWIPRSEEFFVGGKLIEGAYYKLSPPHSSRDRYLPDTLSRLERRYRTAGQGGRQFVDNDGRVLYQDRIQNGQVVPGSRGAD